MSKKTEIRKDATYVGACVGLLIFIILLTFLLPWQAPTVQEIPLPEWGVVKQDSRAAEAWLANKFRPGGYAEVGDKGLAAELIAENPTATFVDYCWGVRADVAWISLVGGRVTVYHETYGSPAGYQTKSVCLLEENTLIIPTQRDKFRILLTVSVSGAVSYIVGLLLAAGLDELLNRMGRCKKT